MTNVFRSPHEPILIKKAAYKLAKVPLYVNKPTVLKTLYIARGGKTRQIMNEKELIEGLRERMGEQVGIACAKWQMAGALLIGSSTWKRSFSTMLPSRSK